MNVLSLLAGLTKRDPHAIIAIDADPDQPQYVSRTELWRRTLQLRADLATAGLGRGDGVLVALPAWSSVLDWYIATASLGAYVVVTDPGNRLSDAPPVPDILADVLRRVGPKVVAIPHTGSGHGRTVLRETVSRSADLGSAVPTVAVVAAPGRTPPVDPSPYDVGAGSWLPSAPTAGMPMPEVHGDELAAAFLPDLAAHRESSLVRHARDLAAALQLGESDVVLCARPTGDPSWLGFALATVAGGGTCLLEPTPSAPVVLADVARFAATHVVAHDELVNALADLGTPRPNAEQRRSSWRWLGAVGHTGPATAAARRAERTFGVAGTALYGSADVCVPAALWPADSSRDPRPHASGGPVGTGVELRVVDPRTGTPVAAGEAGEIQVRGPNVVDSYLDSPETLVRRSTTDGWFSTGDAGTLGTDGGLCHTGVVAADTAD